MTGVPLRLPPLPADQLLVSTVDALVADVHFPAATTAADVAWKALAVNLSDLAAMGAQPLWVQAVCEASAGDGEWQAALARPLATAAAALRVALQVDSAPGPARRVVVQALGRVPAGAALTRAGARPGDLLWVSGCPGEAGAGLELALGRLPAATADRDHLLGRLNRPLPRTALGARLHGLASAAIDVSDGIVGDAGHLARRSGVGIRIRRCALPLSPALRRVAGSRAAAMALSAGDDYELLFTAAPGDTAAVQAAARAAGTPVTVVGDVSAGDGVTVLDEHDAEVPVAPGYDHFGRSRSER